MSDSRPKKQMTNRTKVIAILLCVAAVIGIVYGYAAVWMNDDSIMASADETGKKFKWSQRAVEEGTTVDVNYLWPDETNAEFTGVYRDGSLLEEDKMVTITAGSVYHFKGISDDSILYTEVYVGNSSSEDTSVGKTDIWYSLLPSSIRNNFESDGWTWETDADMTGRVYLDFDYNIITIKSGDPSAVLYGMGLYLDNKHKYTMDPAFVQETTVFADAFGYTENAFASALEFYYTRGGELRSNCPKIHALIAEVLSEADDETIRIRQETMAESMNQIEYPEP